MRDGGMPIEHQPKFRFDPKYGPEDEKHFRVYVLENSKDKFGILLCEVSVIGDNEWTIRNVCPEKFNDSLKYLRFPDRDQAASFCQLIVQRTEEITKTKPLPPDVTRFFEDRVKLLAEECKNLLQGLAYIRREKYLLRQLAERHQVENVEWATRDSDGSALVRKLLEFNVVIKKKQIPICTESAAYQLFGKEEGRTFLYLLRDVCAFIAPDVAEELM